MRLFIVSNRLPLIIEKQSGMEFEYKPTSGGLVSGIRGICDNILFLWIGCINGLNLNENEKTIISKDCWKDFRSIPIFIDQELYNSCYNGFCNTALWPILHSFSDIVSFTSEKYKAYVEYNRMFCEKICDVAEDGDIIWIHDYHLMLLPEMLRNISRKFKIMFFLHTPFPSKDVMRVLEHRKELINGVAHSDLVVFHIFDYVLNFSETCLENGVECSAKLDAIPVGINQEVFRHTVQKQSVMHRVEELKKKFEGKKIILGVDRLDYIKGILHKVRGFERFLEKYSELNDDVVLLQIGIPSRTHIQESSSYVSKINDFVSSVNSKFADMATKIHFLYDSVSFDELCALYAASDILLVTSLRDGMNLVSLEYVACQDENNGVLVLSEFAGVATTLPAAVHMNPWNTENIADSVYAAITMNMDERKERHQINKNAVDMFTASRWAEKNLDSLCDDWRSYLTQ